MKCLTAAALFRAHLCAVLLLSALSAAPAHAALVEFVMRGKVELFNPNITQPGIGIGTPIEASYVVNTGCSPLAYTFSNDADPVLIEASSNPLYLRLHARIGSFDISSDRGVEHPPGQLTIADAGASITRINMNVNGSTPQFPEWNIYAPGLQHSGPIFRRDLDESDLLGSILLRFNEPGPFQVQVSGGTLGYYAFVPAELQVRVLQENPGPCQPSLPSRPQLNASQVLAPDPAESSPTPGTLRSLGFGQEITRHDNTALIWEPGFPGAADRTGRVAVFTRNGQRKWVRSGSIDAPSGNARFGRQLALFNDFALIESETHAFLYHRVQGQWKRIQQLTPQAGYTFTEPTIWNNWAFIGASSATAGAVYVYQITADGTLRGVQTLRSYSGDPVDRFGEHVVISSGRVLVSAGGDADGRGAAYVFELSGSLFAKRQKLMAINGATNDQFATAVGISGDWIAIGAPHVEGLVDNSDNCIGGRNTGAIYVFRRENGTWLQRDTLMAADSRDSSLRCVEELGGHLMISGNWLVATEETDNPAAPLFVPIIYKRDDTNFTPRADAAGIAGDVDLHLSNGTLFTGEPFEEGCQLEACVGKAEVYDLENGGL